MAGLYLIGFAAPAFEAAACHVGETINPNKNVPRAMLASGLMASIYFIVLPVVWLGVLGSEQLSKDLMLVLGPTFAPVFGSFAKAAAIWFMMFNMFHGTLQPLAGASRTLSQLAEDGLLPRILQRRSRLDVPWVATTLTAGMAIFFLLLGDPIWLVAAANFTYLISICLPNVAVWLLRKDQPDLVRPYRAPRGMIAAGLVAASIWGISAILGFQQFGMETVLIGILFAYSGAALYAWRVFSDRRRLGLPGVAMTLHIKLTGAMLAVLALDAAGYLLAVSTMYEKVGPLVSMLEDIFVLVAMLTLAVGLVLPGMIAHAATEVRDATNRLTETTMTGFSRALRALGRGDLDAARATPDTTPVKVTSNDELGQMAASFNRLQMEIGRASASLDEAREELRLARHDSLTGLITRREFERRLESALAHVVRDTIWYSLLYLDLDHFKIVNDTSGHAAGDELLRQITSLLRGVIRQRDSVARLGGDEFAILLENCPREPAENVAKKLLDQVQGLTFVWEDRVFRIGVSIGMVNFHDAKWSLIEVMRAADDACYVAKKKGRNRFHVYETVDHEVSARQEELDWIGKIRRAIDERRFCLYTQEVAPISIAASGEYHRELLIRMIADDSQLILPMAFIPAAERYNLMPALDCLIIESAFKHCAKVFATDASEKKVRWSINLSGTSLNDEHFFDFVRVQFASLHIPHDVICFEITETAAITNFAKAQKFIAEFRAMGCRFSLDDFGAGMSSLAYLKHLPVNYLKIDGAFIRDILDDPIDRAMVEAINKVAQLMDIQTIAECVENLDQLELLRTMGVDYVQGYAISRPQLFFTFSDVDVKPPVLTEEA